MPVMTSETPQQLHFYTTPTGGRFILSKAAVAIISGPMGEGKTTSAIQRWFYKASQAKAFLTPGQPFGIIVIRDTHENNKHSIVKTLNSDFFPQYPQLRHVWRNDYRELWIETDPRIFVEFFGIDDLPSLTKLQGAVGVALIHLEECVPYTDSTRTNAGISEDVFNAALVRCMRQTGVPGSLQMTFNTPDELHWVYHRLLTRPDGPLSPQTPLITKAVFQVKAGENTWLPEIARQAVKAAYEHDEAAYARFVLGETATRYPGKRVASNFNPNWHVAQRPLDPVEGMDSWMSYDSWGSPCCVVGQQHPDGRIVVLDVLEGGIDIQDLIDSLVKPALQHPRWLGKSRTWRYLGDLTMRQPDQSNMTTSAEQKICAAFADQFGHEPVFEPGFSEWHNIREGMLGALRATIGGEPLVLIDPGHCKTLIASLKGAWHHPQNKAGVVNYNTVIKDQHSHRGDCFANALGVLTGWQPLRRWKRPPPEQQRRRAKSYAS